MTTALMILASVWVGVAAGVFMVAMARMARDN